MIIMMGPVGSGKGTQSDLLAKKIGYTHLSSGELAKTFGSADQKARANQGIYLSVEEITAIVEAALTALPDASKVILDGIPRTKVQLDWLLKGVADGRWKLEAVFNLVISADVALERMLKRGRTDDTKTVIAARMDFHKKETEPMLALLRQKGFPIYDIDGSKSPEEVEQSIDAYIAELKLKAD